ncbi:hypothetical protein EV182_000499 [Spiromyces aspiralis]|uniref:Uncharacterized protein n=1 Tax=Spiromyces aspiralis TaxID=68401 RepID=A0ACC1I0G1_9FUNG|nr:hypothetical protein EV182_000499 [Spiromyces aspiralis]
MIAPRSIPQATPAAVIICSIINLANGPNFCHHLWLLCLTDHLASFTALLVSLRRRRDRYLLAQWARSKHALRINKTCSPSDELIRLVERNTANRRLTQARALGSSGERKAPDRGEGDFEFGNTHYPKSAFLFNLHDCLPSGIDGGPYPYLRAVVLGLTAVNHIDTSDVQASMELRDQLKDYSGVNYDPTRRVSDVDEPNASVASGGGNKGKQPRHRLASMYSRVLGKDPVMTAALTEKNSQTAHPIVDGMPPIEDRPLFDQI